MYKSTTSDGAIDALQCVDLKVTLRGGPSFIEARMQYLNSKTGDGFGSFVMVRNEAAGLMGLFSDETLQRLQQFIESVEEDLGKIVFTSGYAQKAGESDEPQEEGALDTPETAEALRKVGIGGSS